MKILVGSDSPYIPSGFARQMTGVATHLADEGHDVYYLAWQTRGDFKIDDYPFKLVGGTTQFGKGDWGKAFQKYAPDVVISLGDAHMVDRLGVIPRPIWFGYYPLDGDPISQLIGSVLRQMDVPVAMANYSQQLTEKELGFKPQYIPHFYKPEEFYDMGDALKGELRKKWNIPEDAFVFGSLTRLNPRKHLQRLLIAFKQFLGKDQKKLKNVFLYLHLDPQDPIMFPDPNHNYQFIEMIEALGIQKNVIITKGIKFHSGIPIHEVNELMNCFDAQIIPTGGEGFGVPFLEAAATGIPTIATDYTTTREHIYLKNPYGQEEYVKDWAKRGIAVPYTKLHMELAQVQKAWIDIDKLVEAMDSYYTDDKRRTKHGKNAKKYVEKYYQYETIMEKWDVMLDRVYTNIELVPMTNRPKKGDK